MDESHSTPEPDGETDVDRLFKGYCTMARKVYLSLAAQYDARLNGRQPVVNDKHNPRWDGGEDDYGKEHKPVWPKIVKTAIECDVEIVDLISAQFNLATVASRPTPGQCHGPRAVANVEKAETMTVNGLRGSLASHQERLLQTVGMRFWRKPEPTVEQLNEALFDVVTDPKSELDPLFRYCEATRLGLTHLLAKDARLRAMVVYMKKRKAYDFVWGAFLAQDLVQTAATVRLQIMKIKD